MTARLIEAAADRAVFQPRHHFAQLAVDHVSFDGLLGGNQVEARALARILSDETVVGVIGPRGAGKSSLIAHVCAQLPGTHTALRVPVTGADDPTDVSAIAAVALSQALSDLDLERHQREALERARADERTAERTPAGVRGGTIGGGPIPAELNAELATLRQEIATNPLAVDRLAGLERLITILVARELEPVFVLEDTEAAIGGAEDTKVAEGFLSGPLHAFVHEVRAPLLIAIQDVFTDLPAFAELAPGMALVEIPTLDRPRGRQALTAIIVNRLEQHELSSDARDLIGADGLDLLVGFYEEAGRNLRFTLAALQSGVEYAAEMRAECVGTGHVRAAISDWRSRLPR